MKYDIKNNLRHNAVFIAVVGILMSIATIQLHTKLVHMEQQGYWGDYLLNIFGGVRIFDFSNENLNFDVPKEYLAITLAWGLLGLRYISSDYSRNTAVFYGNRKNWLVCKLVSNFVIIGLMYLIGIVIAGAASGFTSGFNEFADKKIFKIDTVPESMIDFIMAMLSCMLMTIAISLVQIMISLQMGYFVGFIVIMGIYVASMFGCSELLIGNGIMLLRYNLFSVKGIGLIVNLAVAISIAIIAGGIATRVVKKKDIL